MDRPEGRPIFVGYGMLGNQWMLYWGDRFGTRHECRNLVDEYLEAGIMGRQEVVNRNNPDWPTAAIRLVHTHETVRPALGFGDGPALDPVGVNSRLREDGKRGRCGNIGDCHKVVVGETLLWASARSRRK